MATLTGKQIANSYKQLLQVGSNNTGLSGTVQTVQDGSGTNSALQLSNSAVNINGNFQLNGVTLTANASTLNAVADLTGATGIVAVSAGNVYGRTLTAGTGVSITNGSGTEGNPTIALNTTGVTSASYGPATNIEVNSVGQIVSAGAAASVAVSAVTANTFTGGTFAGTTGDFSSNVSVGGNLIIAGQFSPASLSVTGTINAATISATDATFNNIVSAAFFVGDGSGLVNVPSAEGGTVKAITAGTGIKLTVDAAVTTTMPVSGTVAVSANQNFGTVSVSTALAVTGSALFGIVSATNIDTDELLIAGVSAATVTEVAAVSALTQTNLDSITSINTVVGNVSAVTSVNAAAITSINTVVANVSALTSINAAAITSINTVVANVSALTSVNKAAITSVNSAITSINTVVGNVSAVTSVNAAAITSINTVVANVSALTSVNAAAITSINAVIEGNVSADSGTFNTLTVVTSASVGGTFNVGGNVGIGTSSPATPLHVKGNWVNGEGILQIDANSGQTYSGLTIQNNGTVKAYLYHENSGDDVWLATSGTAQDLVFASSATSSERIRIVGSSGNVGIGTSSPATVLHTKAGSNLETDWIFTAQNNAGTAVTEIGGYGYNHNLYHKFWINDSEKMRIDSSGNVGIGTSSPDGNLNVQRTAASAGWIVNGQTVGVANDSGLYMDASNNIELAVRNGSGTLTGAVRSSGVTFFNGGNVGIGTSSPAKQLHITKAAIADIGTLTDGATITPDFDANQNFSVTLGGNRTLANPTNIDAGQTGSIFVVQDGTGSRTLSFGSYWKFPGGTAPTLSTAAGSVDRIDYIVYTTTAIHAIATLNVS
jgi:hypothetical protein